MTARRIVIAGGTGFIGSAIARKLASAGDEVVILTRSPRANQGSIRYVRWDGRTLGEWARQIDGAHAVINLAGKNVNCRYTRAQLAEIDESRVDAVTVMAQAINAAERPPRVLVQASTTAIFGDRGDEICDEDSEVGVGVPVDTATKWETAFAAHPTPRTRRVTLRMSFVLGREGGVFRMLAMLTKLGLGGRVGTGRQFMSWIHIDDLVRIVERAIDDESMSGLYVASNPNPLRNIDFMREMRRAFNRPWSPPATATMVKIGCFILRTEPVLALTGRRAHPKRLLDAGFEFLHTDLRQTLQTLA